MLERTLEALVVTNDTYIFEGDLTVMNKLTLKDAERIVSGCLTILEGYQVSIEGTDISVGELDINNFSLKSIDKKTKKNYNNYNMLSRVDERIGLMTPQQPAKKQGANTDKAKALSDAFQNWIINLCTSKGFCL